MPVMTVERLHDLFDENPDKNTLAWPGKCHDCGCDVKVIALPMEDGIHIRGGSIYEPAKDHFFLKCDACFAQDRLLRNYQDCEVYSRVVGYLRPVGQWNDAKAQEFRDRGLFDKSLGV